MRFFTEEGARSRHEEQDTFSGSAEKFNNEGTVLAEKRTAIQCAGMRVFL